MRAWVRLVAHAVGLAVAVSALPAQAESLPNMVPRLIEESGFLKPHIPGEHSSGEQPLVKQAPLELPRTWFGFSPHLSLVARDWREAYSITDGRNLVFDRIRMVKSSRMAVARVSALGGRFVPYLEISAGQWRIDPDLFPRLPRDTEFAGGLSMGFEVQVAHSCALAMNVEQTSIHRGVSDWGSLPVTTVFTAFTGFRAEF